MATKTLPASGFFEKHRDKIAIAGPDECWPWTAAVNHKGYGMVRARGKMRMAHREAYEAENGEDSAAGLVIRHRCDNPPCCNPGHLEGGTHADNVRDMFERVRQAKGESRGGAKLTEADVRTIRSTYVRGSSTSGQYALAERFEVSRQAISRIVRRERWTHIL